MVGGEQASRHIARLGSERSGRGLQLTNLKSFWSEVSELEHLGKASMLRPLFVFLLNNSVPEGDAKHAAMCQKTCIFFSKRHLTSCKL